MFTSRKTDSFGLIGTNARNSNLSLESQQKIAYDQNRFSNLFESETPNLESFFYFPPIIRSNKQSSLMSDIAEKFLNNNKSVRKSFDLDHIETGYDNPFESEEKTF